MILAPKSTYVVVDSIESAELYCKFLDVDGVRDVWRLPTYQEWLWSYDTRDDTGLHPLANCIVVESYPNTYDSNVVIAVRDD